MKHAEQVQIPREAAPMFEERRAAQMAAFLLHKAGGRMALLKLMKLMYLADRESMAQYGAPISFDRLVSMDHGPVLSATLNHANGFIESGEDGWDSWISDVQTHDVELKRNVTPDNLDELSRADIKVLEAVWQRFGRMSKWQLRDWTHDHCAEWKDPRGSSLRIRYADVFKALGKSPEEARELDEQLREQENVSRVLASL